MFKRFLIGSVFVLFVTTLFAQTGMGQWRTHFAYNSVSSIAQTHDKIFAVSEGALFSVNKYDESIEYYSKLSGLNDTGIAEIAYSDDDEVLIIVYSNGNIDMMRAGEVENIPDLYNKQMSTSKAVNEIFIRGNYAYLSCDFGIVVLNIRKNEIADSYFIGPNGSEVKVVSTTIQGGNIYAMTDTGIYVADENSPNLVNYESWSLMSGLPGSGKFFQVHEFAGHLFFMRGSAVYKQDSQGAWRRFIDDGWFIGMSSTHNMMVLYQYGYSYQVNEDLSYHEICKFDNVSVKGALCDVDRNCFWFAGDTKGAIEYNVDKEQFNYFKPNGPVVNTPYRMRFGGDKLYVVPGGYRATSYSRPGHIMIYEDGIWNTITDETISAVTGIPCKDISDIIPHPKDPNRFYAAAFGSGLYEFEGEQLVKRYGVENSALESVIPSAPNSYTWVDAMAFDANNTLWMTNAGTMGGVKALTGNGEWRSFENSATAKKDRIPDFLISIVNSNQKWVLSSRGSTKGVGVFDDNGTLESSSDDRSLSLDSFHDQDGKELKINEYFSMAQDSDGTIWVGTSAGPFMLTNTNSVFEGEMRCSRVKIPRNDGTNAADYLLESEIIKAIAIDGANRKWFGTETSGIYLMSANGEETIQHFTTENSPLPSNSILSIAIHPTTGEVFIGTAAGLVSYQSDARPGEENLGELYAFPNPVRETYQGLITITGLMENTTVKIVDVAGNLVCETISNGGVAVWDGKNKFGQRVSTGVYLAICLSEDGKERGITKILFIN